ncbi:hypothetical protein MRX96_004482 [Rhipicephalus microplus]
MTFSYSRFDSYPALLMISLTTDFKAKDRVVASVFGVGRSTVNGIYKEFCEAIVSVLESDWIKMLSPSEMAEHIREFMAVSDFPQAV